METTSSNMIKLNIFFYLEESLGGEGACLVHCDVGVSRSPSLVIAYLMRSRRSAMSSCDPFPEIYYL